MPKRVISTHNVPGPEPFAASVAVLGLDDDLIMTIKSADTIPTWSRPWEPTTAEYLTATLEDGTKRVVDLAIEADANRHILAMAWGLHPDGRIAVYAARQRKLAVEMWAPDVLPADLEAIARAPGRLRDRRLVECIAGMPLGSERPALHVADMARAYNDLVRMARYIVGVDVAEDAADAHRAEGSS